MLTPQAKASVLKLFNQLQTLRPSRVAIEGHTDSVGSFNYNMSLSRKRAESVKAELVKLGSNASIISTLGQSFSYPITSNGVLNGRNQNRRIEVALNGKTFRNMPPSAQEASQYKNWIFPGGKQPKKNTNIPN